MTKTYIYQKENKLKDKYSSKTNSSQFIYGIKDDEQSFFKKQYSSEAEWKKFINYRDEWYRRAKNFDASDIPLAVNIELVSTCNLSCNMCYTINKKFQNAVVGTQRMLPWNIVKKIIDDCSELGVFNIGFSWRGESTLYKSKDDENNIIKLYDVFKYARSKNIPEISTLTHGQTFYDEEFAEKVILSQPSWISISADGFKDRYNLIRTPTKHKKNKSYNAFDILTKSIKNLIKYREKYNLTLPRLRMNSVFPALDKDISEYYQYYKNLGIDLITINEIKDFNFERVPEDLIDPDYRCQFPFQRLTISSNGIVVPCTGAVNEEVGLVLGSYCEEKKENKKFQDINESQLFKNEINIKKLWKSKKLEDIRKLHINYKRKTIEPGCRNCHYGFLSGGAENTPKNWDKKKNRWNDFSYNLLLE